MRGAARLAVVLAGREKKSGKESARERRSRASRAAASGGGERCGRWVADGGRMVKDKKRRGGAARGARHEKEGAGRGRRRAEGREGAGERAREARGEDAEAEDAGKGKETGEGEARGWRADARRVVTVPDPRAFVSAGGVGPREGRWPPGGASAFARNVGPRRIHSPVREHVRPEPRSPSRPPVPRLTLCSPAGPPPAGRLSLSPLPPPPSPAPSRASSAGHQTPSTPAAMAATSLASRSSPPLVPRLPRGSPIHASFPAPRHEATASFLRCSVKTCRLTSSVRMTSLDATVPPGCPWVA